MRGRRGAQGGRGSLLAVVLVGAGVGALAALWWGARSRRVAVDGVGMAETLAAIDPDGGIAVRDLGDGIFELVGEAETGVALRAARALRGLPGVRVVLNRVWSDLPVG